VNLSYSCLGVPCEGAALTCIAGRCASDAVDVTTLPSFVEGLFEDTATGCFDATTCLSLAMPARLANVPADSGASGTSSLDRCTFTIPDEDAQGRSISVPAGTPLNVRVVYGNAPGAGSIPRAEVLNLGPDGFSIPDPTKPGVIRLASGRTTPAPWVNVLANPHFGTVVSESGGAYTWCENAHEFRVTPWSNDALADMVGEALAATVVAAQEQAHAVDADHPAGCRAGAGTWP
jgi:hypothetical protein